MKEYEIVDAAGIYGQRFQEWIQFIMDWEAVVARDGTIIAENDPDDAGGYTFAGLDKASHPNFPYSNPAPKDIIDAYYNSYWKPVHATELGFPVGEVVANFAVNMGRSAAVKLLQEASNTFTPNSLTVDGIIGPMTLNYASYCEPHKLADKIEDLADERYRRIAQANLRNRKFLQGWINRDNALEKWWMGLKG